MSGGGGHGLGLFMAIIFLSGEMAGVGVLALPGSMVTTGPAGLALLIYFTINAMFVGTRLGLCWIMIEEKFPEFKEKCRDPYMVIAEKAGGPVFRHVTSAFIAITLYGSCCALIVLMATFMENILGEVWPGGTKCVWMFIIAGLMAPICMLGTPADFWFVAVGALVSTVGGCMIIMVKEGMDANNENSCYWVNTTLTGEMEFPAQWPKPTSPLDFGKAFSSIMFAFAGASTFPTIQADMKDKSKFPMAAVFAMLVLCIIYVPMAATGYFLLGDLLEGSVIDSLCDGPVKITVEVLFLIHLISAFPILINPPNQFFEGLLKIPADFNWKRVVYRSVVIGLLLLLSLSLPSFDAILNLIGSTTITCLNFIFPPFYYMRLVDKSDKRTMHWSVRVYCWHMVVVGACGGGMSFYKSVSTIADDLSSGDGSCWSSF